MDASKNPVTATRKILWLAAAVMAILTTLFVQQGQKARVLRLESEELRHENRQLVNAQQEIEERLRENQSTVAQLRGHVAELSALRGEVAALRQQSAEARDRSTESAAAASELGNVALAPGNPMVRMNRGRELRQQGDYAEALREYLWCFDEGSRDPAFAGVRLSFLLSEIAGLAQQYPAAREALVSRRDAAEAAVRSGACTSATVFEMTALNTHLQEQEKNLTLFEELPAESAHRKALVQAASDQFLAARRYEELLEARNPESSFLRSLSLLLASNEEAPLGVREVQTRMVLDAGANGVEVLAGVGQNERAKGLADKVLTFNSSQETLIRLIQQTDRAANEDVAAYLKSKQVSNGRIP